MCCSSSPNGGRCIAVNLRSAVERVLRPLQSAALAFFCFFMVFLLSGGAWGEIKKEGGTIATLIPRNGGWGYNYDAALCSVSGGLIVPALPRFPPVDWPSCFVTLSIAYFRAFAKRF